MVSHQEGYLPLVCKCFTAIAKDTPYSRVTVALRGCVLDLAWVMLVDYQDYMLHWHRLPPSGLSVRQLQYR